MLERLARFVIGAPRLVLGAALVTAVIAAIFGIPVAKHLGAGGQQDPNSESSQVARTLTDKFDISDQSLVLLVSGADGVDSPATRQFALDLEQKLHDSGYVLNLTSAWSAPRPVAVELISRDGKSGLIIAGLAGGENDAQKHAVSLTRDFAGDHDGISVRAGGVATLYAQITEQTEKDLMVMESIAIPISFVVLVWIFGGLYAALLPLVVGVFSILGAMAILRGLTCLTDVSIFALNLAVALGLALAIDYSLLMVSRYREEVAAGFSRDDALATTMNTAGRTVLFSALTVALALVALVLFPMYFLKSFAYAGVAVVFMAATAALLIVPAVITLLGDRVDTLDVRRAVRKVLRRTEPQPKDVTETFWYRVSKQAMGKAIPVIVLIITLLVLLGLPFLHGNYGFPDDRVLPESASAHQVGNEMRDNFDNNSATNLSILAEGLADVQPAEVDRYAAQVSRQQDVDKVIAPTGSYVDGIKVGPPAGPAGFTDDTVFFTVQTSAPAHTAAADRQLDVLHSLPGPGGVQVKIGGGAQLDRDVLHGITSRIPWVLGIIAAVTFVLLFLLTGSVVLPLKALVLNVLSLTATFGALVWIFQDGHLGGFGTDVTGTLVANMPILLFCIAFGLSMDYEVFLISRIREYWLASGKTRADNDESVALGVARSGRVVTAAALIMSISFAALIAAQVSFMRMFGTGLTIAILVDATIIRMLLVPAFMRILGRANWWAPKPLVVLHERIGFIEEPAAHPAAGS